MSEENIHKNHRKRLRAQFLEYGMDSMSDYQALELLLFYAIPQRDTNPIAHRLIDAFGSLSGVFAASPEELMRIGELSENAAGMIRLVFEITRRAQIDREKTEQHFTIQQWEEYLLKFFQNIPQETVYLLCLDAKCKLLGKPVKLSSGSVNSTSLSVRSVVECALRTNATSVILAHNHPSGIAIPSQEDIQTTEVIAHALELVGVLLADHIVVADDDFVSMADSGLIQRPTY